MSVTTENKIYDCVVIGGGVIGCSALFYLSKYSLSCALLEAGSDVANGASRANSGIVHAGYDCTPGTKKAYYNVKGNAMYPELCAELGVSLGRCGTIVAGDAKSLSKLKILEEKAKKNGVSVRIVKRTELLDIEPNIADRIEYALYAPSGGIVSPYKLTIALADNAVLNGAEVFLDKKVDKIEKIKDGVFTVSANGFSVRARYVINAAGAGAPVINALCGAEKLDQTFRRGEYLLVDNSEIGNIRTVIFPLPTDKGKGILVAPTVDGNIIYGPTSEDILQYSTATTWGGMELIKKEVQNTYKPFNFRKVIKVYAGVRALVGDDFTVGFSVKVKNLFVTAGICSPGLTAAPAIGAEIAVQIAEKLGAGRKADTVKNQRKLKFKTLPEAELEELIKKDPAWGNVVCRCEQVSEAEIVGAIKSPVPATTTDAVKRRVRAGMGRCSGGFCCHEVMQIIARELDIPIEQVKKDNGASEIITGRIKEGGYDF